MAHMLETMAFVNHRPWHNLGNKLPAKQPIDVWAKQAGMDWHIYESPVRFISDAPDSPGVLLMYPETKVLYRSDTNAPLSVVSERYKVVQPAEVLSFYRDLTKAGGYALETAGVLKGGRKFWALAKTGQQSALKGNDVVKGYLLLATSCDGSLATSATFTSIRVVCANTLQVALNGAVAAVRVPHSTTFDAVAVKQQLGVAVSGWDAFMYRMKTLSERKVKSHEAMSYLLRVFSATDLSATALANERAIKKVQSLYEGAGRGADLPSSSGTAWGLLNSVTQFVDHERRARSDDHRLDSAWFGPGAALKQKALEQALLMVT
jgi:phage/plasmid-like protein (TIGR03299 family)